MSDDLRHEFIPDTTRRAAAATPPARRSVETGPERLASALGNRGFSRTLSRLRDGEGILPSGVVHPDVQSAIAASRGRGHGLDRATAMKMSRALGDDFGDVTIHRDGAAADLARSVSARAFTVGSDVFFAPGEYRPGTTEGSRLLAHELAHVVQQRGAPSTGSLTVSQPGDALERDADAAASQL
jgi:hypothetical protein